jgi:cytochrome c oxidase subunit II
MARQRSLTLTIIAAVIATAIGIALSFAIHWFPVAATTQAHNTDRLYHVLVIASIPIFVLVVTVILYSIWQFRMKPGEELKDGPPIHGNTRLEVLWTALPAALLLGLIAYSFVVLYDNEKKPAGVPEIQIGVSAQQFYWAYEYPSSVTRGAPLRSYQLYLPAGDTIYFNMRSKDVIHAFWIPAFRLQEDVVPGITTHYRATLDRLGVYPVVCNLLCGVGHSLMRSAVHVVAPAQFQAWLKSQEAAGSTTATASTVAPGSTAPGTIAGRTAG